MNINKYDLNNALVICPNSYSRRVLESISKRKEIIDVKFMDLNKYKRNYFFNYDIRAIKYLVDKYNLSINNAREILNNLYYIDINTKYENKKLNDLSEYKKELIDNNLLIFNPLFNRQIKDRKIFIMGYGKLSEEDLKIINGELIEDELIDKVYDLYSFENIEEEVEYLYNTIFDLLYEKQIDINKIFILNTNSDYETYFKRFNTYYPFKIDYKNSDSIIGTKLVNDLRVMFNEKSREEIFDYLKNLNSPISKRIINIINKYPQYDLKEIQDYIIHDLRNIKSNQSNLKNVVKCSEMFTHFEEDEYVFVLGFSESFPNLNKDDDYLSDDLKNVLGISSSEIINDLKRYNTKTYLSNIHNLYLSYCKKSPFNSYNENNLFERINKKEYINSNKYSDYINRLKLSYSLDRFDKYGIEDKDISLYMKTYDDIDYGKYNNSFNGLNDKQIKDINTVNLSYSSMDEFYKCQFKYYLEYILKLRENDDNFNTKLGSIAHEVLKEYYENDEFDFEKSWNNKLNEYELDSKELFFLNKLKKEIKEDIEIINKQDKLSSLNNHVCEEKFKYDLNDSISFNGFIDKLNYKKENEKTIVSVIDYKSGSYASIKEKLFEYGLSLQLPSYMYLLSKDKRYENIKYAGFYLQYLINNDYKYNSDLNIDDIKNDSMKLHGYTTNDLDRVNLLDSSIEEGISNNIHGLKLKKDGSFSSTSKIMSDERFDELVNLVDEKILEAGNSILSGDFKINPKQIDKDNESCAYCPYSDICFKRNDDLIFINTRKEKE